MIKIEDLIDCVEIDTSAVHGGVRALDSGSVEIGSWITDVLVGAAQTGGAYMRYSPRFGP